ncbi:M48 family metallopeptidase [Bacillus sp. 2205SS5-2]|uniref:M48 family metallopeptidase n=1 Tax=Bacillus sp. 2205SS5-2 TaxID=3109031 RepID=UPI0030073856
MLRKWSFRAVILYLFFGLFMYLYLFIYAQSTIPADMLGSSADPATFMNSRELMLSEEYSKIRNLLFFLSTPYEWLLYFLVLIFGISRGMASWAEKTTNNLFLQKAVYLFWLSLVAFVLVYPLQYLSFTLSKMYHLSTQSFSQWMKDEVIDFWVNYFLMFVIVVVIYALMKKFSKKWWLGAWVLSIPFTLLIMFIQPVIIDPLYNDFYPLKDKELETKILALGNKANIPAEHVYEVDMSEKTTLLNAYVSGIGSNSRIVLWDTTIENLSEEEILFVMAHEMAHYVEKHIFFGIGGYLLLSFIGLWLIARWMEYLVRKHGKGLKVKEVHHISSLPLFFILSSFLLFAASPLTNLSSRYMEIRADTYAIELTEDKEAAISSFQELSRVGLSQVNPPYLVKLFRYTHPTMMERLIMLEKYEEN